MRGARDLYKPRVKIGRHISFADEHGTPAQRLYNLLCVAYGSDKELFADVVEKGICLKAGRRSAKASTDRSISPTAS